VRPLLNLENAHDELNHLPPANVNNFHRQNQNPEPTPGGPQLLGRFRPVSCTHSWIIPWRANEKSRLPKVSPRDNFFDFSGPESVSRKHDLAGPAPNPTCRRIPPRPSHPIAWKAGGSGSNFQNPPPELILHDRSPIGRGRANEAGGAVRHNVNQPAPDPLKPRMAAPV